MTTYRDSEKYIERYLCTQIQQRGGICLKYSNQGAMGYPDRLCILPGGVIFWAELKSKGKHPTTLQKIRIDALTDLGCKVYVCDSVGAVDRVLDQLNEVHTT